jgi:spore maturation protein SpmA
MALNYTWALLIIIGFIVAIGQYFMTGNAEVFQKMLTGIFDSSKTSFEICLGLAGIMTFWMGIMKIGEKAGLLNLLARVMSPFFRAIYPSVPAGDKSLSSLSMNFSANMLGLDNAATPLGLQAMRDLQELNKEKETASDAQLMFLVLNTAGVTIIPTSVIALRQTMAIEQGLVGFNGADIFIPTLMVTYFGFLVAFLCVAWFQKINLLRWPIIAMFGLGAIMIVVLSNMSGAAMTGLGVSIGYIGSFIILCMIMAFIFSGFYKKINMYDAFVEGGKDGFQLVISIAPYLVVMLFAVSVFRTSGCLEYLMNGIRNVVAMIGLDTRFVEAVPVGLMKPLSGSGARGILVDVMKAHGVESFVSKVACIIQGGTETTFYILAVYFGSVGIKNSRYALFCGLVADFAALIIAIFVGYAFWG